MLSLKASKDQTLIYNQSNVTLIADRFEKFIET